jgi:hypothetical protein
MPFIYSLSGNPKDYQTAKDYQTTKARLEVHITKLCQEYEKQYSITYMD